MKSSDKTRPDRGVIRKKPSAQATRTKLAEGSPGQKRPVPNPGESAMRTSEEKFRRLSETAQDGILLLDASTGKIKDANPFIVKLLGYRHQELVGKTLWEIGPFRDAFSSRDAFHELQWRGHIRYEDLPLETKDGHRRDVEFVSNVYQVGDQKVVQCNVRDIPERKRKRCVFKASEDRFRKVFNEGPIDIATVKKQYYFI